LYGLPLKALQALAGEMGLPRFAGTQLAQWLYRRHADDFAQMTDLSREARLALSERCALQFPAPLTEAVSRDGTKKYLLAVFGESVFGEPVSGQHRPRRFIEAAYIPEGRRGTLCLSVQVGCRMGCRFCMTGRQGFAGNLSPGEILNQYRSLPEREAVTNIVYMGMGEPLDNLENVLTSLEIFRARWGYALSPTRITVSTVGLLPALERLLAESRSHLAVSLHSPFPEERRLLAPIEKAHPMKEVLRVLPAHPFAPPPGTSGPPPGTYGGQRRLSFEYVLLRGINHSAAHARELGRLLGGLPCRVNLIPYHPLPAAGGARGAEAPRLQPCSAAETSAVEQALRDRGLSTTVRRSRGLDIQAACGLLSTQRLMQEGT